MPHRTLVALQASRQLVDPDLPSAKLLVVDRIATHSDRRRLLMAELWLM
jgi:hypothetical protein